MPRTSPFQCHTCGTLYTGGRCPKCYPKKPRRGRGGRRRGGGGRRVGTTAAQVLGCSYLPVNVEAVVVTEDEGELRGEDTDADG